MLILYVSPSDLPYFHQQMNISMPVGQPLLGEAAAAPITSPWTLLYQWPLLIVSAHSNGRFHCPFTKE